MVIIALKDQGRAEAEELLLYQVKGAHAVLGAGEDEGAFGRSEEHPGEVDRLRPVNAGGFKQFCEVRDPDLEDLSRRSPSRLRLAAHCDACGGAAGREFARTPLPVTH